MKEKEPVNLDYALAIAAAQGNGEKVLALINKGADVHVAMDAPLRWASQNDHLDVVNCLIRNGADVSAQKNAAIRWAAARGHISVVKALEAAGANLFDMDGWVLGMVDNKSRKEMAFHIQQRKIEERMKVINIPSEVNLSDLDIKYSGEGSAELKNVAIGVGVI